MNAIGIAQGQRVLIVSENRPQWVLADLAVMLAGGISVPAYITNTVANHLHIIRDSGAKFVIVSTRSLAEKVLPACIEAGIKQVAIIDGENTVKDALALQYPQIDLLGWRELLNEGRKFLAEKQQWRDEQLRAINCDDVACLIYTSGTGGNPVGVMLSHKNILSNCQSMLTFLDDLPGFAHGEEVFLSFLPLSHSYEHTVGLYLPMACGAEIYYAENFEKLLQNIAEARPTLMTAVPRLYETIRQRILHKATSAGGLGEKLLHQTLNLGKKAYECPGDMTWTERIVNGALTLLVRKKLGKHFGGRLKAFVSGGAPLNYDVGCFFLSLEIQVLQGYGQTESSPVVSVNPPSHNKVQTVGPPLQGVEVHIADDGEIAVRGDLVMKGYWKQPEKTAKAIQDGWLYTGDIGQVDENGYISITDRKKDIIVNSGGDNISPQRVEGILCLEPEIMQAMVYGDKRPWLVALIVPDDEFVREFRKKHSLKEPHFDKKNSGSQSLWEDLAENPTFIAAMGEAVNRACKNLAVIEKVRRFKIIPHAFSVENEMMTASMKIRRHIIKRTYADILQEFYQ